MISPKHIRAFRRSLLHWYSYHCRHLPWRRTQDAYAILVSEVMLQQTQAAAVVPYYIRWLRRFPTILSLARATESDVLHAWQGLGYYARARNLHHCSKLIVEKFHGVFPSDPEELKSLPGIGPYTGNAIAVFAFDHPRPLVEANTGRVLSRLFDIRVPIDSAPGRRKLWDASAKLVPQKGARNFQNAMMDLGALICTARNPRCQICPVKKLCCAQDPGPLPYKRKRPGTVSLIELHAWCTTGNSLLLEQCRQRWRGMWMLPTLRLDSSKPLSLRTRALYTSIFPFTHHRVTLRVYRHRAHRIDNRIQRWFCREELNAVPIPSPHRRAITALLV